MVVCQYNRIFNPTAKVVNYFELSKKNRFLGDFLFGR